MVTLRLLAFLLVAACGRGGLDAVHAEIEDALPGVSHVEAEDLAVLPGAMLFDVRSAEEYAVSRLPGAVRLDPDMTAEAFLAQHGEAAAGHPVVFYCSVGWRSSLMADRVGGALAARGGQAFNLRGGAFGWVNADRPLEGPAGPTDAVHAYDRVWGRLIDDPGARVLP